MGKIDELDDWRRTHISMNLNKAEEGQETTVMGSVTSIRKQGGITFLIIQDREGISQITIRKGKTPEKILNKLEQITIHSIIAAKGRIHRIEKAPQGAEIIPGEIKILNTSTKKPPFSIYDGRLPNIDKRLDIRSLELRRTKPKAIFKIRHEVSFAIREYLSNIGYMEVQTPKIIASATEGGASLFPVLYYNKEAFLAQSPQLYKEQLTMCFEKIFEVGPVFRAEPSRTLRHLSEIISIDVEEAYISYIDIMELLERLINYSITAVSNRCKKEIIELDISLDIPKLPFKRYTYDEVVDIIKEMGESITWGDDLSTSALKKFGEKESGFYFITDWPTASKPFYIKPKPDGPKLSESFDLMAGNLEISSGGTRVSSKKLLTKRLKDQGLKPRMFDYHLKLFDYGMPPHAGFGLGLDRFMMVITREENIREVTLFPRDRLRLTP